MNLRNLFFLLLCCILTQPLLAQVQDSLVPAEVLFKRPIQHTFSISPNGKIFTEVIDKPADNNLYIVDIDAYELKHTIPLDSYCLDQLYWLSDNRILYESGGAIYAIDIDGSNKMKIVSRRSSAKYKGWGSYYKTRQHSSLLSLLPAKKHMILVETLDSDYYATVKEVNVFTGAEHVKVHGKKYKMNGWFTDARGAVRLGVKAGDHGWEYFEYNGTETKPTPFHVYIDGVPHSLTIKADSYLSENLTLEGFGVDPDIIYITSNVGSDKRKLISYNMRERKVVETVAQDINCDIKDLSGDGIKLIHDYNKGTLAGVRYSSIMPQFKWFSQDFAKVHAQINQQFPQYVNDLIDSDVHNNRFVVAQWNDREAGNIGIFDASDNSYAVMFHFNEELNSYQLSKTKTVIASMRDDYKVQTYVNLPVDYDPEKSYPLVVIPHGGPWARDYWELDDFTQYFASRGFITVRINFRGSTGFGKEHVMAGINSLDQVMIDDIVDATNFIKDRYKVADDDVHIFGHSYGGYAAYMSVIRYPEVYRSAVAVSAPTDIRDWLKMQRKQDADYSVEFWNAALGSKKSKYLQKVSPINYAEYIERPFLIFHGKYDEIIPVEQAEDMAKEMERYDKNVQLEVLHTSGHSIRDNNVLGYVLDRSIDFFNSDRP